MDQDVVTGKAQGLVAELEHGVAVFDDAKAVFVPAKQLPLTETWRRPSGCRRPRRWTAPGRCVSGA